MVTGAGSSASLLEGGDVLDLDLGPGVRALVTTRAGGVSPAPYDTLNLSGAVGDEADLVRENRARVEARFGMPVTWLRAVHGNDVHVVEEPGTPDPHLDALVTARRGTALAALAADCVPVLLTARDEVGAIRAVGAVHSGRRGVASGVVPAALDALRRTAGSDGPVTATIGPAICGRCYEVRRRCGRRWPPSCRRRGPPPHGEHPPWTSRTPWRRRPPPGVRGCGRPGCARARTPVSTPIVAMAAPGDSAA